MTYSIPNLKPGAQNFTEQPVPSLANGPMEHVWRPRFDEPACVPCVQPVQMVGAPGIAILEPAVPAIPAFPVAVPIHQVLYSTIPNASRLSLPK